MRRGYKPVTTGTYKSKAMKSLQAARKVGYRRGTGIVKRTVLPNEAKVFDCENTCTALAATTTTWVAGTIVDPTSTINLGAAAVATPLCLFAPTVGSSLNQRVGRSVRVTKIKIHGDINSAPQAAQNQAEANTQIRIILVQDMQTNAAQMTSAALMNGSSASANVTLNSFQNPDNFGRFRVLKEKWFKISNLNLAGSPTTADVIQGGMRIPFKMTCNFKYPVEVQFNNVNGGTVADLTTNSFHLLAACDSTAYAPTLFYYSRVMFEE